ncbi:hypothetical protein H5410_042834 [Solanum commersonii]|uniref:Uncharacterized protein n=1 Tax=Solanum commersonii TaxID=4109 RepID=A0A9J5XYL4_SOLCO|nr:hypothetical protein H5410_042834 [Solanum commersonii]
MLYNTLQFKRDVPLFHTEMHVVLLGPLGTMICIGMRNLAGKQHLPTLQKAIICPETSVKRKAESIGGSLKLTPAFT